MLDAAGNIDTQTRMLGNQFFYGPLTPDEPQYLTTSITTGLNFPNQVNFVGGAAYNGEGEWRARGRDVGAAAPCRRRVRRHVF